MAYFSFSVKLFQLIKEKFLDFLFLKQCINCGKYNTYLCKFCERKFLEFYSQNICHVCKNEVFSLKKNCAVHEKCMKKSFLDEVFVCLKYSRIVEEIIKEIKYKYHFDVVTLVVDLILKNLDISKFENSLLVPIPLHKIKKRIRGFNQAELIAKQLSKKLKKNKISTEVNNLLMRIKNTKTQVGMTKEQRSINLKSAFSLNKKIAERQKIHFIKSKIILIDDVMTTGTTLEECAKLLIENGFENIKALVFARG